METNRVLIVDDDARIGRIIKRVATSLEVESSVIDDPDLFETAYLTFQPNIIFLDLQMPRLDGIELLRWLGTVGSNASIVLMSGMDKSVMATALELGKSLNLNMGTTLHKPVDVDDLKSLLIRNTYSQVRKTEGSIKLTATDLRMAIERDELVVHYQPKVCFRTGQISGAEALVRWQHPEYGMIFPDSFVPIAEKDHNLIGPLTYKVLETAVQDYRSLRNNDADISLSINLSAKLLGDLALPDEIERVLDLHQFDPHLLMLEVTESVAMEDPSLTMDVLTRLRLKNVRLSLDDFGTGFSSLLQLYRMPFNELKVDKSFVMRAMIDREAAEICRVTIDLGHSLGLDVVAEGVEDKDTYDWLKTLGCEVCQGYFVSRPLDASAFKKWIIDFKEY